MKKFLALLLLAAMLVVGFVGCKAPEDPDNNPPPPPTVDPNAKSEGVMTHAEFMAAEADAEVTIEAFVQAKQSWWQDEAVVYLQDGTGGYYVYKLPCTEEQFGELAIGTKIKVTGAKTIWGGMHEIMDVTDWSVVGTDKWTASAIDITAKLGDNEALVAYTCMLVKLSDMTVVSVAKGNDNNDMYVTFAKGEAEYSFTVEEYLTAPNTDFYAAVEALTAGDVVDIEGFVQWYNGKLDLHMNACEVVLDPNAKSEGVMTHAEFMAAEADAEVTIEAFVQAKQSWWQDEAVVYLQDGTGGYYVYKLPCTEAQFDELTIGTKIQVTGAKTIWGGMHEIMNVTDWKVVGTDKWVAAATDVTDKLGDNDALVAYTCMLVKLTDMTVVSVSKSADNNDIYVTLAKGEAEYSFTVEEYLTAPSTEFYQAIEALAAGDVVDVQGFVQWYNGKLDLHMNGVTKK